MTLIPDPAPTPTPVPPRRPRLAAPAVFAITARLTASNAQFSR